MEERVETLFRALGDVGSDLIDTAEKRQFASTLWRKWLPVAACLALLMGVSVYVLPRLTTDIKGTVEQTTAAKEQAEAKPKIEQSQESEAVARLVAFGMVYYPEAVYSAQEAEPLLGQAEGVVTQADDEAFVGSVIWSKQDCARKDGVPLEIFVEQEGAFVYCVTYYAPAGPLLSVEEAMLLWKNGTWNTLIQTAADTAPDFAHPSQLNQSQLVDFFVMTLELERQLDKRTEDLNHYLWLRDGVYRIPLADVNRQLARYLEGFEPFAESGVLILQTLEPTRSGKTYAVTEDTRYDLAAGTLSLAVGDRIIDLRVTESGCYFERIVTK